MNVRLGLVFVSALLVTGCFNPDDPDESGTDVGTSGSTTPATGGPTTAAPTTSVTGSTSVDDTTGDPSGPDPTTEPSTTGPTSDDTSTGDETSPSSSSGGDELCGSPDVHHVFLDLDGAEILPGEIDNGPGYVAEFDGIAGEWGPYADDDIEEILGHVRNHFAPYPVCVTDQQPDVLDYMVLVVTTDTWMKGSEIVVSLNSGVDCGNASLNNIDVAFFHPSLNLPPITKAITISQAIGRKFGLDVVEDTTDIMHRFQGQTNNSASFTDACVGYHSMGMPEECAGLNGPGCDAPDSQQNSHAYLLEVLGGV